MYEGMVWIGCILGFLLDTNSFRCGTTSFLVVQISPRPRRSLPTTTARKDFSQPSAPIPKCIYKITNECYSSIVLLMTSMTTDLIFCVSAQNKGKITSAITPTLHDYVRILNQRNNICRKENTQVSTRYSPIN